VIGLFAQIDLCINLLLVTLNGCIGGTLDAIVKL
jgi:hypothetical protein